MTQYAYYHPATFEVIDWIDTSSLNVVLPDSVISMDDEQWRLRDKNCWVYLNHLEFITTPPHGRFYRLQGNEWVYDEALFVSALESVKAQVIQAIKAHRDDVTVDYIVIDGNH
ncbi:hypothetical protein JF957_22790, partial [Salmonella enterica subsp. enterica serovar Hadar]|nr:hypothetical protein [Salmonella enterica subsp. enterica serovar Hadar]